MDKKWKPTTEQQNVINAKGDTIVSASAGSGKTTVMIERLVRKIVEDKLSLENVLAVTFTKKAAGNMKDKLRERIGEAIADADNIVAEKEGTTESADDLRKRLVKEYELIATADISTIDAFCLKLVKNYFYEIGCDTNSEIADDKDTAELYEKVFDDLFTGADGEGGYYGKTDENGKIENDAFATLLTYLRKKRKDDGIKGHIIEAYKSVRVIDDYKTKLKTISNEGYTEDKFDELYERYSERDKKIYEKLLDEIDKFETSHDFLAAEEAYERNYEAMRDFLNAQNQDKPDKFCEEFKAPEKITQAALAAAGVDLDAATKKYMNECGPEYTKLRNLVQDSYNEKIATRGKKSRDGERDAYFQAADIAKAFIRCLFDFDEAYADEKKKEGKLDYGDLEEFAIELLGDSAIRDELNERYTLIFVDEFQDVNRVQNKILSFFDGEKFYVGDQKQAIYGFRGSESKFFSDILTDFKNEEKRGEGKNSLTLNTNFRSDCDIIKKVNDAFGVSMTEKVCDVEYGEGHAMTARDDAGEGRACLRPYGGDKEEKQSKGKEEKAHEIYSVKKAAFREKKQKKDETLLSVLDEYLRKEKNYSESDICILCRFNSQVQSATRLLIKNGYTVSGGEEDNILENSEVKQMLGILSYIDDEEQNLPMIATMLSPVGDFTEEELAAIKAEAKNAKTYRDCVREYMNLHRDELSEKIKRFYDRTEKLRETALVLSAGALIDEIMIENGLEVKYSKDPDKLKRLSLLSAEGENMTVPAFLKAMTASDAAISMPASAGADGIKIMTMHSAKGLQFKVVIVYDVSENFERNKNHTFLFDEEQGFAFNAYDEASLKSEKTLLWRSIEEKQKAENIKQELNLFYVACTRAKERLDIIVKADAVSESYDVEAAKAATNYATLVDLDKFGKKAEDDKPSSEAPGEGDDEGDKEEKIVEESEFDMGGIHVEDTVSKSRALCDADFEKRIAGVFETNHARKYSDRAAKTAVSARVKDDDDKAQNWYDEDPEHEGAREKRADGAEANEVGTAYHKFLELCDFDVVDPEGIEKEIEEFFSEGKMTKEQRDILENDLCEGSGPAEALKRVRKELYFAGIPEKIYRERRFICNLPAKIVYDDDFDGGETKKISDELSDEVLVQGIIDLLVLYEDGKWRIIDYKHSTKDKDALWTKYGKQLELYAAAAARILKTDEKGIGKTLVNINPKHGA